MLINRISNPNTKFNIDLNGPDAIILHCDSNANATFTRNLYNYLIMHCLNRPELNTADLTGGSAKKTFSVPAGFVLELFGMSLQVSKITSAAQVSAQMGVGYLTGTYTATNVNQADNFDTIFGANFRVLKMRTEMLGPCFSQLGLHNFPNQLVQEHDTNFISGGSILTSNLVIPNGANTFTCFTPIDTTNDCTAQFQVYAYGRLKRAAV